MVATYATGLALERIPSRFGVTVSMAPTVAAFAATLLPLAPLVAALLYGGLLGLGAGTVAALLLPPPVAKPQCNPRMFEECAAAS